MENNAQLLKGVLEYCVLRLIEKEPTYGYEIVMQLKQVGFAEISESTLYPLLLRLEQQEKVTVERRPSPKGPSRKYYVITEKGTDSLLDFQQEWNRLCGLVACLRHNGVAAMGLRGCRRGKCKRAGASFLGALALFTVS